MQKILIIFFVTLFCFSNVWGQENLPHKMTDAEAQQMPSYLNDRLQHASKNVMIPAPYAPVRTMAEWEELQGLLIGWTSYPSMLREIVRAAKNECRVYILTNNQQSVISYLASGNVDTVNVSFINAPFNSVWSRDYGPWSAYTNDVDTLVTIDWIYNRPRPNDDNVPVVMANLLATPLYQTTVAPDNLIHTGGNFMCDGFGTGFSSNLIVNENPSLTVSQIDTIMKNYMGITRYIKMPVLPYDAIHHIDMHMKLLDEETLLMGQYPPGIADGPQIEANLLYVTSTYPSVFGTPYKVIRIPMPADNGAYPNTSGDYFTYTNSSFINKTIIVPTYNVPEDTTALRIYRDALPGYNVVGINSLSSIGALGALHCITKDIGTNDPLLISHQQLTDTYDTVNTYQVRALIKHRSGIQNATLFYRTDTLQPYLSVAMNPVSGVTDQFEAAIPPQSAGTIVYYYIAASSNSGKSQVRPMPAPAAYFSFKVLGITAFNDLASNLILRSAFPNPANAITCIPFYLNSPDNITIEISDVSGKTVYSKTTYCNSVGEQYAFFDANKLNSGIYLIKISNGTQSAFQKIAVSK